MIKVNFPNNTSFVYYIDLRNSILNLDHIWSTYYYCRGNVTLITVEVSEDKTELWTEEYR